MKRALPILILAVAIFSPSTALAQQKFEFAPFIAWRHGNDLRDDPTGIRIDLESGSAYGFIVDVTIRGNLQAEFIYSYRKTNVALTVPPQPTGGPSGEIVGIPTNVGAART